MKILIAHIHYPVSSGLFLKRALTRLGHDVRSLGPSTGRNIWGVEVPEQYVQVADYPQAWQLGMPYPTVDSVELGDWLPDLVITSDSSYAITGRATVPHILYAQDNHVRNYRALEAEGAVFDMKFVAHSWGARVGEPNVYWSPACYDPDVCKDLGLERVLDVCSVGYPYQGRMNIAAQFRAKGIRALFALGLVMEQYNQAYNQAKIALVKSALDDLPNRFFEGMAQGCCVLADRTWDASKLGFVEGEDYWPYSTPDDAVQSAEWLIRSGRWRGIAENGKRRGAPHTWDARAQQMLDTVFEPMKEGA